MTQFCISCGAALRPNVKFCTKCGATTASDAISADVPIDAEAEAPPLSFKRYLPHILGTLAFLAVIAVGGTYLFGVPKSELPGDYNGCADGANAAKPECAEAAPPEITGNVTSMYIVAEANVRDRPTAKGSNILQKMLRGTSVSGVMQIGEDETSQWFKLADGRGYVGAVNLSAIAPPKLSFLAGDWERILPVDCTLLAAPMTNSAIKVTIRAGARLIEVGSTENEFWEYKLPKGGVGYTFKDVSQCGTASALAGPTISQANLTTTNGFSKVMNDNRFLGEYVSEIADQDVTIGFNVDAFAPPLGAAGYANYTNKNTYKSCSSLLHLISRGADGSFVFRQSRRPDQTACGLAPTVTLRNAGAIDPDNGVQRMSASWKDSVSGKVLMSGSLQQMGD